MTFKTIVIIVGIWAGLLLLAFPVFYYCAGHPEVMLWMEETQHQGSIQYGYELLRQGYRDEAIAQFERCKNFYHDLFVESHLEQHKIHMTHCMIAMADTWRKEGTTKEKQQAIELYQKAIEMYPRGNSGLWFLSCADIYQELENFESAIEFYNRAITNGYASAQLFSHYGRGRCMMQSGKLDDACDDLYTFLRYRYLPLSQEQWEEFIALKQAGNKRKAYILAQTYYEKKDRVSALRQIKTYLADFPTDRSALYYITKIDNSKIKPDIGELPLKDLFPVPQSNAAEIVESMFNFYMGKNGRYRLTLTLSGSQSKNDVTEFMVQYQDQKETTFISGDETSDYSFELNLSAGRNIVFFRTALPGIGEKPLIAYLHHLQIQEVRSN